MHDSMQTDEERDQIFERRTLAGTDKSGDLLTPTKHLEFLVHTEFLQQVSPYQDAEALSSLYEQFITPSMKALLASFDTSVLFCHFLHCHQNAPFPSSIGYFSVLPLEVHLYMLQFMKAKELLRLRQVCFHFNSITRESSLWKRLVERLCHHPRAYTRNTANKVGEPTKLVHNRLFERFGKTWEWLYRSKTVSTTAYVWWWAISWNSSCSYRERGDTRREGEWQDEELHGYGIAIFPTGRIEEGEWKHGKLDGYGRIEYTQLTTGQLIEYEGEFKYTRFHGGGVYRVNRTTVCIGTCVRGAHQGKRVGIHLREDFLKYWEQGMTYERWIDRNARQVRRYNCKSGRQDGDARVYTPKGEYSECGKTENELANKWW